MKPALTMSRKEKILVALGKSTNYLMNKPVSKWDAYDRSNWNSIIKFTKYQNWKR